MQQLSIFDIPQLEKSQIELRDLFDAYYSCRSSKRNTINALAFETDFESILITLWNEMNSGTYQPFCRGRHELAVASALTRQAAKSSEKRLICSSQTTARQSIPPLAGSRAMAKKYCN